MLIYFYILERMIFISNFFISNSFISILIIFTIIICIFFIPTIETLTNRDIKIIDFTEDGNLLWPSPGYTHINSNFGKKQKTVKVTPSFHYE